ncbi:MAG: hypothetical protein ACYS32_19320, partial [Planctomycetota bacterium]
RLTTVPYAFRVSTVDGASGGTITGEVTIESNGRMPGDLIVAGRATIGPGNSNLGVNSFVAGQNNTATGSNTTICGGDQNVVGEWYSTVSGGYQNVASGSGSTVGGGSQDTASGPYSVVGGGGLNIASQSSSTVSGGNQNTASGGYSTVGGGADNTASGLNSTIGGGQKCVVAGNYSAIPAGFADTITADAEYSYLFGIRSKLTQDSTFMVDMPHIRFGDEASGYEFPPSDGSANQVMTTDGNGQVSWNDVTPPAGFFPAPAWQSGWFYLSQGGDTILNHGLGYDSLKYVIDMQFKGGEGIHNHAIGALYNQMGNEMGAYYHTLTSNSIRVTRRPQDAYVDSVRVRIWITQ